MDKIERVENGLVAAICIEGKPLSKKNLLNQMQELKIPAASIAVINNGKIEWAKAYGTLASHTDQKTTPQTQFQAGSVSKPVAAFAILSLVQKGLLSLDESVNEKLVSWKIPDNEYTAQNKISLRHLLSHTSGLNVIGFDGYRKNEPIPTITQTLDGLAPANNPAVRVEFLPFSKMSYSGGAYNVAQQLAEDICKMPFAQFMEETLLNPLEMQNSTFEHLNLSQSSNVAHAHPTNGIPMEDGWKSYPEGAAAGLWTTPTDLAKWLIEIQNGLIAQENGSILDKELLSDMATVQVAAHGLGPVVNGQGSELQLSHKGRTDGFTCGFVSFPYLKQGAVVMINAGNEAGFVDDVLRSIACEYNWPSYSVQTKKTVELPANILEKYVGRYGWGDKPNDIYDLFIFREGNKLFWKMGSASNANELYCEAEDLFFLLDIGYSVVFQKAGESVTSLTIIVQAGFEREFKRF